ncbi:hypothetical protein BXZ70DRAFT_951794 [Cristinia sonorae]|uniref:Hemerythrin-like domain-containing protein n=1 Tax=Cristinia sonorae TaxID=1940300 RepID=A0A8K0XLZ6_9AGAR|nr:hypothetical protein BXZ70DRAFT_951794 [Cristinia sonorae]
MVSTSQDLSSAIDKLMVTAKGAQPADVFVAQAWEMAGAHAFILNALLDVYEQAPTIPKHLSVDFVGYALQWVAVLHHHHSWEEEHYYPMFTHKYDTSFIVAEHETFTAAVHEMEEYLISCLPSGEKHGYGRIAPQHAQQEFSATHLQAVIDKAAGPLSSHLLQEVTYLHSDKLHEAGFTVEEIRHIAAETNKYMMNMPTTTFLVYVVLLSPKGSEFPPAPPFIKNYVVPWVLYWPNRRWWKFGLKNFYRSQ